MQITKVFNGCVSYASLYLKKFSDEVESSSVNMSNKKKLHVVISTLILKLESEKEAPVLGVYYITEEKAKNWVSSNARKPRKQIKTWGVRLQKRWKELDLDVEPYEANDLDGFKTLFYDLELNDPEAVCLLTLKELESEGGPEFKTQSFRKDNKSKNLINKEFECLEEIKGYKRSEKDLEFRE